MWFVLALSAALCFGLRGILYQWTSQRPVEQNILLFGVYVSGALISTGINLFLSQPWSLEVCLGALMGIFSFIANAAMFKGYSVGRASVIAIFTGFPPVVVALAAYILWGESLNIIQMIGFIIIIFSLFVIRYDREFKVGKLQGLKWGLLTMLFFGLTDVFTKQATLLEAKPLPVLTMMYGTGALGFAGLYLWNGWKSNRDNIEDGELKTATSDHTTSRLWTKKRTLIWGLFIGVSNIAGMVFLISAFRLGTTSLVSAISSMNIVIVLLYAHIYLKERLGLRVGIGLTLALVGVLVLRVAT
ncbi:DMT family transporter [Paenibacillus polysaccharolyticus]|uniref:DMT family transporter n=1 Tax=Paenibacillus polysaccharolyticus TaxID=582692 RepID=UPI0020A15524|nr:DMT family transporter [Paenibacillus polysaccharolyticus]MCP1136218.1 DMT family transporter [Paenibacillus polysaccharolyticus]